MTLIKFEHFHIEPPNGLITEKTHHQNPEIKTPLAIFELMLAPSIPDGVAVFRDKDGKEVGRITNIGE